MPLRYLPDVVTGILDGFGQRCNASLFLLAKFRDDILRQCIQCVVAYCCALVLEKGNRLSDERLQAIGKHC